VNARAIAAALAATLLASCAYLVQVLSTTEVGAYTGHASTDGSFSRTTKSVEEDSESYGFFVSVRPLDPLHVQHVVVDRISRRALAEEGEEEEAKIAHAKKFAPGYEVGPPPCEPDPPTLAGLNDPDPSKRP